MGFLKKLFAGKEISAEEQMRRMGNTAPKKETGKPVAEMTEDEKLDYWARARELTDLHEKKRRMEELANVGYDVAYLEMHDVCLRLADPDNLPFDTLEYWARKAADAKLPGGYMDLGMIYSSPKKEDASLSKAVPEYLKAMEYGEELAAERIKPYWDYENSSIGEEESARKREILRCIISEAMDPEIEKLKAEESVERYSAFGILYYYGIYFEQDLNAAKACFVKLADMGVYLGRRMLENSVFADDEDEDE